MMRLGVCGFGVLIVLGFGADARAAETKIPLAKNPPKVFIDANRASMTKVTGGDFDDRMQKVQLEVLVRNANLNVRKVEGLTLFYWAMGQSLQDRKAYTVIDSGSFDVTLDNTQEGREIHHKGEEIALSFDDSGVSQFGHRYKGFVIVLMNAQREVVAVKANQPSWQTYFERAFELRKGAWFDLNLKPTPAPSY